MATQNIPKSKKQDNRSDKRRDGSRNNNKSNMRGKQGRKDSRDKRVNYDTAREDKVAKSIERDIATGRGNDISEYVSVKNAELFKSAADIQTFSILGRPYNLGDSPLSDGSNIVPGVLAVVYSPEFGPAGNNEAINQATRSYLSKLVHANSRNYKYTGPDLMMVTYAGIEVFSILVAMERAYAVGRMYSATNEYLPNALLEAMGFNPADIYDNLPTIYYQINRLIQRTRQIWVPNVFPILQHRTRLNASIYKDAEGDRGQIFLYVQHRYFQFQETKWKTGTSLETAKTSSGTAYFTPGPWNKYNWSEWYAVANSMINALLESEDRGIMYGDILNCYGAENIYAMPAMTEDIAVDIQYSAEVLMQLENLTINPHAQPVGLWQSEELIAPLYNANDMGAFTHLIAKSILNYHVADKPSPEMVMESTRFTTLGRHVATVRAFARSESYSDGYPLTKSMIVPTAVGTESVTGLYYAKGNAFLKEGFTWRFLQQYLAKINVDAPDHLDFYNSLNLMAFDWHPFIYLMEEDDPWDKAESLEGGECNPGYAKEAYGDFDNYTVLVPDILQRVHDVALDTSWGVPHM